MNIDGKNVEIDTNGFLVNPDDWNHDVASALAKKEGLKLNDDYWVVFDLIRDYYHKYKKFPGIRYITTQIKNLFSIDMKKAKVKIFRMFPYGYVDQACKISGMKSPINWDKDQH